MTDWQNSPAAVDYAVDELMVAVMDFHPESKRMRLQSVHAGVTLDQVRKATGFELLAPEDTVPETRSPSQEQVRLIRDIIDPDSMRKREFRRRI